MELFYLVLFVVSIFMFIAQWKMVAKSGQPGIAIIIPIWNLVVMVKLAGYSGWYILWYLVPLANVVFAIIVAIRTCKAFGKDGGFVLLFIFFPWIAIPILGFGDADWNEARVA